MSPMTCSASSGMRLRRLFSRRPLDTLVGDLLRRSARSTSANSDGSSGRSSHSLNGSSTRLMTVNCAITRRWTSLRVVRATRVGSCRNGRGALSRERRLNRDASDGSLSLVSCARP